MAVDIEGVACVAPSEARADLCLWTFPDPTWGVAPDLPGLDGDEVERIVGEACAMWATVCGIRPRRALRGEGINLYVTSQRLDGPGRVLADCMLPCGSGGSRRTTLTMRIDNSESWAPDDLLAVVAHELGHGWGLGHLKEGNLMQPYYTRKIRTPQAGDAFEMVRRYGRQVTPPPPPPPDPGTIVPPKTFTFTAFGVDYRATRI